MPVCLFCSLYPWSCPQPVCFTGSFCLTASLKIYMCMYVMSICLCVCENLSVSQILGAQKMPLPAWVTGCLRCTVLSQKGGELGLSIQGCELQQWLDKAAWGSQPITSLPSVLHSYGCMIGPGVAGRGMDKWWKGRRDREREREREWLGSVCHRENVLLFSSDFHM